MIRHPGGTPYRERTAAPRVERRMRSQTSKCAVVALAAALALTSLVTAPPAASADDAQLRQLQQDVRDLRRTVAEQARRIEELERGTGTVAGRPGAVGRDARTRGVDATVANSKPTPSRAGTSDTPPWVSAARWAQLRPGASELEVVDALGPPTSMRTSDDGRRRTLYYALEIGASGYLAGSVVLEERRVVEVNRPELR